MQTENLFCGIMTILSGMAFGTGVALACWAYWQRRYQKESQQPKRLSKEEIARKTEELRISQSMGDRINDVDG